MGWEQGELGVPLREAVTEGLGGPEGGERANALHLGLEFGIRISDLVLC